MSKIKVSVLIPVYNRENYIEECVNSALNQTYQNFEIVIVDNCSTDKTWELCCRLSQRDKRIRVFRNTENIGPVRNWTRCAELANGEYSKMLFSDDLLMINCLEEMVQGMESFLPAFVYSSVLTGETIENSKRLYGTKTHLVIDCKTFVDHAIAGRAPVSPGAILIRTRDLIKYIKQNFPTVIKWNYASNGAGSDVMIMMLAVKENRSVLKINYDLVFFRRHGGSITISDGIGEIQGAYDSVYAYFLKDERRYFSWQAFILKRYIRRKILNKQEINLVDFIRRHEGSFIDLALFLISPISLSVCYVRERLNNFSQRVVKIESSMSHK